MKPQFAPGIVVLNKRYFSRDPLVAAQVGASSFALSVLRVLIDHHILSGIVLYSRDEQAATTRCEVEDDWDGVAVVTVYFNFGMSKLQVAAALDRAFRLVPNKHLRPSRPIVYYQTDTLLQYHPQGYQFCVTHHGPFVAHFAQQFSPDLARLSFGGAPDKADLLCRQQHLGVQRLLRDGQGTVLAHSRLQQRILEGAGLGSARFLYLRPPIGVPPRGDPAVLPAALRDFVRGAGDGDVLLFTAAARLDYFKNAELLVRAGLELLAAGVRASTLLVGDPAGDGSRRAALMAAVPAASRPRFMASPRLAKDQLYALFGACRGHGVFLCPSRYETLGITPLEAAAAGVATLVTEAPGVEALAFLAPAGCSVAQDAAAVAARVRAMCCPRGGGGGGGGGIPAWAERAARHVRPATSLEGFRRDLLAAWASMSVAGTAPGAPPPDEMPRRGSQPLQDPKPAVLMVK